MSRPISNSEPGHVERDLAARRHRARRGTRSGRAREAGQPAVLHAERRPGARARRSRSPPPGWRGSPRGRPASGRRSGGRSSETDAAPTPARRPRAVHRRVARRPTTPTRGPTAIGRPSRHARGGTSPRRSRPRHPRRGGRAASRAGRRRATRTAAKPSARSASSVTSDARAHAVADLDAEALEDREVLVDLRLRQPVGGDRPADHAAGVRVLLEDRHARRRRGRATRRPRARPGRRRRSRTPGGRGRGGRRGRGAGCPHRAPAP